MTIHAFITSEDINEQVEPPFGEIGSIVFTRTYSRWIPEEKRRESYAEAMARMVNHNVSLAIGRISTNDLQQEASQFYKRLNELLVWGSGRSAWVAGTKATEDTPESLMNCASSIINRFSSFEEALHLLCLGCGYGFRIYPSDLAQLSKVKNTLKIDHKEYRKEDWVRGALEDTTFSLEGSNHLEVKVGDSRKGWCDALGILLESSKLDNPINSITFDYSAVRPENERILGFGGRASGPEPLKSLLSEVNRIISMETLDNSIRPINALDILCCIGDLVRSGNVRRSSLIALVHPDDKECINAKQGLWTDPKLFHKRYRSMSNNSISYDGQRPSKQELLDLFQRIRIEGEPGFVRADKFKEKRLDAARKWRPEEDPQNYVKNAGITNPCGEISLSGGYGDLNAGGFCNLSSLPLPLFVKDSELDVPLLTECLELITRFAIRQTLIDVSLPEWNKTQEKERLIGVDVCGWWEAFDALGIDVNSEEANEVRAFCKSVVNNETTKYAKELGIPRPLLATTGKPNGSFAQLATVSSGCHAPYAPYYLRRIRMAAGDALAQSLVDQKIPFYPETAEWESYFRKQYPDTDKTVWQMLDEFNPDNIPDEIKTYVFEFPVKTKAIRATKDISALEQLENYKNQMIYYIDHNQSVTITVADHEWSVVAEWVYSNWDYIIGVSFLPLFADDTYPLLPYQQCSEEEYLKRVSSFSTYPVQVDLDILSKYEKALDGDVDDVDLSGLGSCTVGGACPLR